MLAAIFLGETVGLKDLFGGALILCGFGITSLAKYRETKADEEAKRKLDPEREELIEQEDDDSGKSISARTDSETSLELSAMVPQGADDTDEHSGKT